MTLYHTLYIFKMKHKSTKLISRDESETSLKCFSTYIHIDFYSLSSLDFVADFNNMQPMR